MWHCLETLLVITTGGGHWYRVGEDITTPPPGHRASHKNKSSFRPKHRECWVWETHPRQTKDLLRIFFVTYSWHTVLHWFQVPNPRTGQSMPYVVLPTSTAIRVHLFIPQNSQSVPCTGHHTRHWRYNSEYKQSLLPPSGDYHSSWVNKGKGKKSNIGYW